MFGVKFYLFGQSETCFTSLILKEAMRAVPIFWHVVYCWYWHGACLRTCLRNRVPWGKEHPVPGCWNWGPGTARTGQATGHEGQQCNKVNGDFEHFQLGETLNPALDFLPMSCVLLTQTCLHPWNSGYSVASISSAFASHVYIYSHIICTLVHIII